MANGVYINKISSYLPGKPVSNDEMEEYLGVIGGRKSRSKAIVLRSNGIKNRYYALTKNSEATHTNAQLTANAIKKLFSDAKELKSIELLTCGTTTPDQLTPSHAVMVHGLLPETSNTQVISFSGVCCTGMHALKHSYLSVLSGDTQNAVVAASERTSAMLKHQNFEEENKKLELLEANPIIAFDKEFLRWMLSDGAAAAYVTSKPNASALSLKVEWIENYSFANEAETCMYMGGEKYEGGLKGWADHPVSDILGKSLFTLKQDVKLLDKNIVKFGGKAYASSLMKHNLKSSEIDYYLPHISSMYFADKIYAEMELTDTVVPRDKWFLNLPEVGNVGAASIFLALEALLNSGKLKKGEKIFLSVPESARFSYSNALLTVV
ncbi:MAG TPA: beta-ketoacyl-ACP synthase III [Bacteroidia bacterium]|nr:beta-ketoacyl-ACP synthase III [Bacteroidia bacterium]